jgi:ATP-dependent DNA helicase RecG
MPEFTTEFNGLMITFKYPAMEKTSGKIIAFIQENPQITIPELANLIQVSERSIERNIQKLQTENKLQRIGGAKGGYWEVEE